MLTTMTDKSFFNRPTTVQTLTSARRGSRLEGQVVVENAEAALATMLEKIHPAESGWRAMILTIPGHLSNTWQPRPLEGFVHVITRKALSIEGIAHVYLLADNDIVVLVREIDAQLLPGLEQVLIKAFSKIEGDTLITRYDLATQSNDLLSIVHAKQEKLRIQRAEKEQLAKLAQQEALKFSIPAAELALRPCRQRKIILIVEDDPSTSMLLAGLIDPAFTIVMAQSAAEAVAQYRAHIPDLVFLDIGLPDVDGLTVLQHLKAADPQGCVVMLTANGYRDNLDKARAAGVSGFVAKPFTRSKIQQVMNLLSKGQ